MSGQAIVVWDYDGVLNRNMDGDQFKWTERFEVDIGHPLAPFEDQIFSQDFTQILTGQEDVLDRVKRWAESVGYEKDPEMVLSYWFENDQHPDESLLALIDNLNDLGVRQVLATNNERRRVSHIQKHLKLAERMEHVFASGRMGVSKPDPAFFRHVTSNLSAEPCDMILIDDGEDNVLSARKLGWRGYHFCDQSREDIITMLESL